MITTKYFVFIHLPKTGGNFVREVLTRFAPGSWEVNSVESHEGFEKIPEQFRNLPVLGIARNPLDWYVSWYWYQKKVLQTPFFLSLSGDGKYSFKDTMLKIFDTDFTELLGVQPNQDWSKGCLSVYFWKMFGPDIGMVNFGRFESLRDDLKILLENHSPLSDELISQLKDHPRVNHLPRKHYSTFYDEELRELVVVRERIIFEKFEYDY